MVVVGGEEVFAVSRRQGKYRSRNKIGGYEIFAREEEEEGEGEEEEEEEDDVHDLARRSVDFIFPREMGKKNARDAKVSEKKAE